MSNPYLLRKPSGLFLVRVRVPLDLVSVVGRKEIRRSLGTASLRDARRLSGFAASVVYDLFRRLRVSGDKDEFEKELRRLRNELMDDQLSAARSFGDGMSAVARAQSIMLDLAKDLSDFKEVTSRVREADLIKIASALASTTKTEAPDLYAGLHENAKKPWRPLVDDYFSENTHLSKSTVKNYGTAFRYFEESAGKEKTISEISKLDITKFRDHVVNSATARGGRSVPSSSTQQKLLTALKSFFAWSESKSYRNGNPVDGVAPTRSAKMESVHFERRPFTKKELENLFQLPLFSGAFSYGRPNLSGDVLIRDHRFWFPIVSLWTGTRKTELMNVCLGDIQTNDDVVYIGVYTSPEKGEEEVKRFAGKTKNARRIIPLHPYLLKNLGFQEYIRDRKSTKKESENLFPEAGYGQTFNQRLLPAIGLGADPTVSLHSLRHCFKDMLRNGRIDGHMQNRLLGHAPETAGESYGSPLTEAEIRQFYESVTSPVDLTHLYPNASKRD